MKLITDWRYIWNIHCNLYIFAFIQVLMMPGNEEHSYILIDDSLDESQMNFSLPHSSHKIDLINVSLESSLYVVGYEKPWLERSVVDLNSEEEDHDSGDSERAYINSNEKDNTDYKNSDSVFPPDDDNSLKRTSDSVCTTDDNTSLKRASDSLFPPDDNTSLKCASDSVCPPDDNTILKRKSETQDGISNSLKKHKIDQVDKLIKEPKKKKKKRKKGKKNENSRPCPVDALDTYLTPSGEFLEIDIN